MALVSSYWLVDAAILLASLVIVAYWYMTRNFEYWKKRGVFEIKPTPFIGNFGACLTVKASAGQWLQSYYECSVGHPYMGLYIFDKPALLLRDPDVAKNIFIRDFSSFQDRFGTCSPTDPLGSSNLFFCKNPAWKLLRSKLTPIYTSGRLKKMFELMLEVGIDLDTHMNSLNLDGKGKILEMKELCAKFTTDMIGTTAFGLKVNSLNNPEADFRKHGRSIFDTSFYRSIEFISLFFFPNLVKPLGFLFLPKDCTNFLRKTMWDVLIERERSGIKRNDLIDLLIELRSSYLKSSNKGIFEFDGDHLVAQTAIFFTGGFETSSTTISFTLYELALNSAIQSKLREEIIEALEKTNGKITYDLTFNLPYLDMVVSETLRKYPPLPFVDRVANQDYKVPNSDFIIEKGTPVYYSMAGIQNDPQYFPQPEKYDPERFSEVNRKTIKSCTHLPFGEGPHTCIGMRLGLLQSKFGLIKLLSQYKFSPCKDTVIPMNISKKTLVTSSDGGIVLNVSKL